MTSGAQALVDRTWTVLADVPDPEIPVLSIVDLGIVRDVRAADPPTVVITPTYTGCPATAVIERDIRAALDGAGLAQVTIVSELSPAWSTDWITPEGRDKLHAYGIAPPTPTGRTQARADCPRCASDNTEEISQFGSTPCKALWRCRACGEPFDRFKCL